MNLKPEVLHRLLLAKSILSSGRGVPPGQPNAHLVAKQVLNAHDAADLAFAAIADKQGKLPATGKVPFLMQCLEMIDTAVDKHVLYFSGLNDARNSLKHTGNLPNTNQWASVSDDVFQKLSGICLATLGVPLDDLDESNLLLSDKVRVHLAAAKTARISQEFKLVLEELAKALFFAFEAAPVLEYIQVGQAKAEDALKLSAFGVSTNDFLRLQEFLPMVSAVPSGQEGELDVDGILWKQSGFGHPGNWRDEVADFCIGACLGVALSIQNAPPVPYAREFSHVYDYRVTAKKDEVEVWEDLADDKEHWAEISASKGRPSRTPKRFLRKGESLIVSPQSRPLVSDDQSSSGELMKRVQISHDDTSMFGLRVGFEREEFVNLEDVDITCIPNELYRDLSPTLPEIPWEDDPLAFLL